MVKIRQIFTKLVEELENNKILLLIGPRQVGKTTLLKQLQEEVKNKETFYFTIEDIETKELLDIHPYKLFDITKIPREKEQIIFIDEIQYLKNPSNFLKLIYDMFNENIKLVVSGSSSFYIDKKFKDSLMGRKRMFEIFTLNFEEFLDFKDELEIKKWLFIDKKIPIRIADKSKIEQLFLEYITYGGYPEVVLTKDNERKKELLGYLANDYIKKDIYDSNIEMSAKFFALLKILTNQVGELVNVKELANTLGIDTRTADKYLYVMQKSYCVAFIKPFWTNIRAELIKMPKIFFFDLGLRNFLINDFRSIVERIDKGQYFENLAWRELLFKYGIDNIQYWRNQNQNEIDFIIEKENKAFEAKFSKDLVRESKYKVFKEKYSKIELDFITFENILEKIII